jgi:hypothetical protein
MNNLVIAGVALLLGSAAMAQRQTMVKDSGTMVTQTRTVAAFERVNLTGSSDVMIQIGPTQSVTVTADENIAPRITTETKDGVLVIGSKGNYWTKKSVRVVITVPSLKAIRLSGSGNIDAKGIASSDFGVDIIGSGNVSAMGKTQRLSVSISGSGDAKLSELIASEAMASVSGSGGVSVHATDALSAKISGSGDIRYAGNPKKIDKSISGSGDINAIR